MKYKPRPTITQRTKLYELIKEFAIKNDYNLSIIKNNKMTTTTTTTNRKGNLYVNDYKKTENHPDYTGKITISDKEYYLSGWKNTSQNGKAYISITIGEEVKEKTENKKDDLFI